MIRTPYGLVPAPATPAAAASVDTVARLRQFSDLPRRAVPVPLQSLSLRGGLPRPPASSAAALANSSSGGGGIAGSGISSGTSLVTLPSTLRLSSTLGTAPLIPAGRPGTAASGYLPGARGTGAWQGGSTTGGGTLATAHIAAGVSGGSGLLGRSGTLGGGTTGRLGSGGAAAAGSGRLRLDLSAELAVIASRGNHQQHAVGGGGARVAAGGGALGAPSSSSMFLGEGMGGVAFPPGLTLGMPPTPGYEPSFAAESASGGLLPTMATPGHGLRPSNSHADRTALRGGSDGAYDGGADTSFVDGRRRMLSTSLQSLGHANKSLSLSMSASDTSLTGALGGLGAATPASAYRSADGSMLAIAATRTPAAYRGGDLGASSLSGLLNGPLDLSGANRTAPAPSQLPGGALVHLLSVAGLGPGVPMVVPDYERLRSAPGAVSIGVAWPGLRQLAWVALSPPSSAEAPAVTLATAVEQAGAAIRSVLSSAASAGAQQLRGEATTPAAADWAGSLWEEAQGELEELLEGADLRAVAGGVLYPLDTPLGAVSGLGPGGVLQLMRVGPSPQPAGSVLGGGDDYDEHRTVETQSVHDPEAELPSLGALEDEGYATEPPMALLRSLPPGDLAAVPDFTVYRPGFGAVTWPGDSDLRGLDLCAVVRIVRGDVIVYRDSDDSEEGQAQDEALAMGVTAQRPPVGTGLNKPAVVELEGVWPGGAEAPPRGGVTDSDAAEFEAALQEHCGAIGAQYVGYDRDAGLWRFGLPHFEPPAEDSEEQ